MLLILSQDLLTESFQYCSLNEVVKEKAIVNCNDKLEFKNYDRI